MSGNYLITSFFHFFLWNLVKKRTFCQKWRPLKKKGQNVSFRELKDEKGRVDSPGFLKFNNFDLAQSLPFQI